MYKWIWASLLVVGCATQPKVPNVCVRNLRDCVDSYQQDRTYFCNGRGNAHCAKEDWVALCKQDLNVCMGN